jgi:hypothetical protein
MRNVVILFSAFSFGQGGNTWHTEMIIIQAMKGLRRKEDAMK